jgi:hypothetical protein
VVSISPSKDESGRLFGRKREKLFFNTNRRRLILRESHAGTPEFQDITKKAFGAGEGMVDLCSYAIPPGLELRGSRSPEYWQVSGLRLVLLTERFFKDI